MIRKISAVCTALLFALLAAFPGAGAEEGRYCTIGIGKAITLNSRFRNRTEYEKRASALRKPVKNYGAVFTYRASGWLRGKSAHNPGAHSCSAAEKG